MRRLVNGEVVEVDDLPALTSDELESQYSLFLQKLCDYVDSSARALVEYEIQPVGMMLVDRMTRYDPQNTKALAVDAWVTSVYVESERRKSLVQADMWPGDEDANNFSSFGKKPHTIAELMAEYQGI